MIAISTTTWWATGFVVGGLVVVVAASLLLAIIMLGQRIVRQANDIVAALDGARRHTAPLFDVAATNHELDRITRHLATVREGLERG